MSALIINLVFIYCLFFNVIAADDASYSISSTLATNTESTTASSEDDQFKCSVPDMIVNGSDLDKSLFQSDFTAVSEIKFPGIVGPLEERLICKIKCIDGQWVGPLCAVNEEGRFQPIFRECVLPEFEQSNLFLSFRNKTVLPNTRFAHGSAIQTRCKEIGKYKLLGDSVVTCNNGDWNVKFPTCIPTSLLTNFTEDAPPTIVINIPSGSAAVEPSGELFVYPKSTIHLDCIVVRGMGNPEWSSTTNFQHHIIEWSEELSEKDSHYRLILSHVKPQDSGIYTCATALGVTNSIVIQVVSMHCEPIELDDKNLIQYSEGTNLGQSIKFSCPVGFNLDGEANITCQGSGNWSDTIPKCVRIVCPRLQWPSSALELVEFNASYGGRAVFRCSWGYILSGEPIIRCDHHGKWTDPAPTCIAVQCPPPLLPVNGHLAEWVIPPKNNMYGVGDLVQYSCKNSFVLRGEASIVCTETGFWSHPPPFCVVGSNNETVT